mgnify:CR=1 FL=1
MGLDNIPKIYACKKLGTAILDEDGRIDCKKTQDENLCPWKSQLETSGIKQRVVLGVFGAECWYRGKYAQSLISEYDNSPYDFYGEAIGMDDNGNPEEGLTSSQCMSLSDWMNDIYGDYGDEFDSELADDWNYISWWLSFVSKNCDGFISWY